MGRCRGAPPWPRPGRPPRTRQAADRDRLGAPSIDLLGNRGRDRSKHSRLACASIDFSKQSMPATGGRRKPTEEGWGWGRRLSSRRPTMTRKAAQDAERRDRSRPFAHDRRPPKSKRARRRFGSTWARYLTVRGLDLPWRVENRSIGAGRGRPNDGRKQGGTLDSVASPSLKRVRTPRPEHGPRQHQILRVSINASLHFISFQLQ